MFRYTVRCEFVDHDPNVEKRWLNWLTDRHIDDVITCGATGADIVKITGANPTYEIRYRFENKVAFEEYEANHAPRLREEGAGLFPHELGLNYSRTTGEVYYASKG